MKIKLKNLIWAMREQGPLKRIYKNFCVTRNGCGLFHKRSHLTHAGNPKIMYNTRKTAQKSASNLEKKRDGHLSVYKCIYCDGFHLGRNRDNK